MGASLTRIEIIFLAGFLIAMSGVNAFLTQTVHRSWEIFPMTSWQMFSGRPKKVARAFRIEVYPEPGATPIDFDLRDVFSPRIRVHESVARRIILAIKKSAALGCVGIQFSNYRSCVRNPKFPWELPPDIANSWMQTISLRLNLTKPPSSIAVIGTEFTLAATYAENLKTEQRAWVLRWSSSDASTLIEVGSR